MFDLNNIHSFLKGVNLFYDQFNRRDVSDKIIWQEGSTRLVDYNMEAKAGLPILFFIPSLINKSYILDLEEEISMVKYFASLGFKAYLLDFAEPLDDELNMAFVDYKNRISRAIESVCKKEPVVTIGYCLGGVFSCALHSENKLNLVGQILLATPWDFFHLQELFKLNNPLVLQNFTLMIENLDRMPPSLIQWAFSYLSPNRIWDKFCQFSTMKDQQDIDRFMRVEQWVNDGISLTKVFAQESLGMIVHNSLNSGEFLLDEKPISLQNVQAPCLIINASEDQIVPLESSLPFYSLLQNKDILVEKTGHIGLVISKISKEKIWPKMEKWLLQFSQ